MSTLILVVRIDNHFENEDGIELQESWTTVLKLIESVDRCKTAALMMKGCGRVEGMLL